MFSTAAGAKDVIQEVGDGLNDGVGPLGRLVGETALRDILAGVVGGESEVEEGDGLARASPSQGEVFRPSLAIPALLRAYPFPLFVFDVFEARMRRSSRLEVGSTPVKTATRLGIEERRRASRKSPPPTPCGRRRGRRAGATPQGPEAALIPAYAFSPFLRPRCGILRASPAAVEEP